MGICFEFDSAKKQLRRREYEIHKLQPGEVLVRVTCCTICASDLHTFCGRRSAPEKCVLGHEIVGLIEDWGGETPADYLGKPLAKGQRVTWTMACGCGDCFYCQNDLNQKCESLFKYGHQSSTAVPSAGLSNHCLLVPGTPIFAVPENLPDEVACPANCATATVFAALRLLEQTHNIQGANALVVGVGMLGLTAVARLNERGANSIIAVDRVSQRLELAKKFGATKTIQSESEELPKVIEQTTNGRGVDFALDFTGNTLAIENALSNCRQGGCLMLVGSVFPSNSIAIDPEQIVRKVLTLRGIHNYVPEDLAKALCFLQENENKYPFSSLVSRSLSLEQAPQAFQAAMQPEHIRVAVKP